MVAAATDDSAGLIFQRAGNIGLGGLESGDKAKNDSGEDGDGEVEEKNAKIGRTGNIHAAGIGGQIDFHEGAVGPKRYGETSDSPERGKRKTLDQELADDVFVRGAHRPGDTLFPYASSRVCSSTSRL